MAECSFYQEEAR